MNSNEIHLVLPQDKGIVDEIFPLQGKKKGMRKIQIVTAKEKRGSA